MQKEWARRRDEVSEERRLRERKKRERGEGLGASDVYEALSN